MCLCVYMCLNSERLKNYPVPALIFPESSQLHIAFISIDILYPSTDIYILIYNFSPHVIRIHGMYIQNSNVSY